VFKVEVHEQGFNHKRIDRCLDTLELHEIFFVIDSAERQELTYRRAMKAIQDPVIKALTNDKERLALEKVKKDYREREWFFGNMRLSCENYLIKMFIMPSSQGHDAQEHRDDHAIETQNSAELRTKSQESSIKIAGEMGGAL